MASLNKCMAEEFSTEKTYALEALVVYNEKLYICTNAGYIAGEFSLDNFEQTTLAELLSLGSLMDNCIAPPYDNTSTYTMGDAVEYKKKIYSCITEIETAEEFDSDKWEECYLMNKLSDTNNTVNEVIIPMTISGTNINWKLSTSITLDGVTYKATQVKCTSANYASINGVQVTQNNTLDVSTFSEIYGASASSSSTATIEITYTKQ